MSKVIRTISDNRDFDPSHVTVIEVVERAVNYAGERGDKRPSEAYLVRGPLMAVGEVVPDAKREMLSFHEGNPPADGLNGWLVEDLILVLIDRMAQHQSGPFACVENGKALEHLRKAWAQMCARRLRRINQGTSGTQIVEKAVDALEPKKIERADEPAADGVKAERMTQGRAREVIAAVDALSQVESMAVKCAFTDAVFRGEVPPGAAVVCAVCRKDGMWLGMVPKPDASAIVCDDCQTKAAFVLTGEDAEDVDTRFEAEMTKGEGVVGVTVPAPYPDAPYPDNLPERMKYETDSQYERRTGRLAKDPSREADGVAMFEQYGPMADTGGKEVEVTGIHRQPPPGRQLAAALARFPNGDILEGMIYDLLPLLDGGSTRGGTDDEVKTINKAMAWVGERFAKFYGWKVGAVMYDTDEDVARGSAIQTLARGNERLTLTAEVKKNTFDGQKDKA